MDRHLNRFISCVPILNKYNFGDSCSNIGENAVFRVYLLERRIEFIP